MRGRDVLEVDVEKKLKGFHLRCAFAVAESPVVLFGPSGSGKSLTLQCIAGLVKPERGRVVIGERTVFDSARGVNLPPQERRVGYVFQDYALFPHLSVADNIAYGLHRLARAERHEKVAAMMRLMRLDGLESRRPRQLSGGQQQRVAVARALVTEPAILLLDEPFSALDGAIRSKLRQELLQVLGSLDVTAVIVTHSLEEAYVIGEKMVVYDAGRVLQVGDHDEVLHRPASRPVARFTGAKNIFTGVVTRVSDDGLEVEGEGLRVVTLHYERCAGDKVEFCIRPEHIMLLRPGEAAGKRVKENRLAGRIVQEMARGSSVTLFFKIADLANGKDYDLQIEVPAHVHEKLDLARNKDWTVSLKKSCIHVF